jgi:hypothetical protein
MWGPRVSRPLLFLFHLPVTTPRWGRGATPAAPPMAAAPTALRPRMRATPAEIDPRRPPTPQTLADRPFKSQPSRSSLFRRRLGLPFNSSRSHQRREEGEGRRRKGGRGAGAQGGAEAAPCCRHRRSRPGTVGLQH